MKNRIVAFFVSLIVLTGIVAIGPNKLETTLCDEEVYGDTLEQMDSYSPSTLSSLQIADSYEEDTTSMISCAKRFLDLPVQ